MGYAVYKDPEHDRWAGYGVPAPCDMPGCERHIDRGLGYKCEEYAAWDYLDGSGKQVGPDGDWEEEVERLEDGCGLYFCDEHSDHAGHADAVPKPDSSEWVTHMLTNDSWVLWREANPEKVKSLIEGEQA